jgi:hypothetical protein
LRTFQVHSPVYLVSLSAIAGVFSSFGALIVAHPPGAAVGATHSNRWFGFGLAAFGALGWLVAAFLLRRRLKHPVVP